MLARLRIHLHGTVFYAVLALVLLFVPRFAQAAEVDDREQARVLVDRAEADDAALDFERAVAGYEQALALDPSMPKALRASERAKYIRARSEGNAFGPLVMLERVRRDPARASNAKEIDDLVRAAEGFPPGLVRVEARVLAAEAYANRLGRPHDAVPLWRSIATDPAADPIVARNAARSLAGYYMARGDYASADRVLTLGPSDERLVKNVRRLERRHYMHLASIALVVAVVVLSIAAVVRARRAGRTRDVLERVRASRKVIALYGAYVALLGAALASGYEEGTSKPFVVFGAVLVPLLFLARAWSAAGSISRAARAGRAVLCGASALSAAFLVLETIDVGFLEGMGL